MTVEREPESLPPRAANGLGIAGFVVSLVGLLATCGLLCPVGLVLSLVGLRREPRGFAIAGAVIGGLGSLLIGLYALAVLFLLDEAEDVKARIETSGVLAEAEREILEYRRTHGELPNEGEAAARLAPYRDAWDNALRYERTAPDEFLVRSAGADGVLDTVDDLTSRDPGSD